MEKTFGKIYEKLRREIAFTYAGPWNSPEQDDWDKADDLINSLSNTELMQALSKTEKNMNEFDCI